MHGSGLEVSMSPLLRALCGVGLSALAGLAPRPVAAAPACEPAAFPLVLPLPPCVHEPVPPAPAKAALRVVLGAGTSDLSRLGRFQPALRGGGEGAARAGMATELWVAPTFALGGRIVVATDSGADPGSASGYHFRRALVFEPSVTLLLVRSGPLDFVVTGGAGVAAIREGVHTSCLFDPDGSCAATLEHDRIGLTASAAFGALVTWELSSLSLLFRLETIGGRAYIESRTPAAGLETNGLALTLELGGGWAW
jgi:hypothetical protein